MLPFKTQIIILFVVAALSFTAGALLHPSTQTTTKEDVHKITDVKTDKDVHEHTTTTTVKDPTGKETTVVDTVKDTVSKQESVKNDTEHISQQVITNKKTINVSAIIATSIHDFSTPTYGISVSKEVLGPLTVGAIALSDGVFGVTVGMNF